MGLLDLRRVLDLLHHSEDSAQQLLLCIVQALMHRLPLTQKRRKHRHERRDQLCISGHDLPFPTLDEDCQFGDGPVELV
jgi:ABC-type Fe2+-enterobactin transport system substrate-binding protein